MPTRQVTFTSAAGARLAGRLELPVDGEPVAYALVAHCFTCSKDLKAVVRISRALARSRIAVLRCDFTGVGESEGAFETTTLTSQAGDLVAAAEFLAAEHEAPQLLVGHSLGGAAVLQAAAHILSARAVATIATPYDPRHVRHLLAGSVEQIEREGWAEVVIGGRRFRIGWEFLRDLEEVRMREAIAGLGRPLLIFHSPADDVVPIDSAARIYTAARHPKSFVSLDDADHLLTRESDAEYVAGVLAAWARRYVGGGEAPAASREEETADSRVTVRTGGEGYRTEVLAGRHALVVDEPRSLGGTDEGPTPYDLLAAALGACTAITLHMYASRKGWPLDEVTVRLAHRRSHAVDEQQCETRPARLDLLEREVELTGALGAEQRQRLLEIADKCPVHRTLTAGIRVESRAADGDAPATAGKQAAEERSADRG